MNFLIPPPSSPSTFQKASVFEAEQAGLPVRALATHRLPVLSGWGTALLLELPLHLTTSLFPCPLGAPARCTLRPGSSGSSLQQPHKGRPPLLAGHCPPLQAPVAMAGLSTVSLQPLEQGGGPSGSQWSGSTYRLSPTHQATGSAFNT